MNQVSALFKLFKINCLYVSVIIITISCNSNDTAEPVADEPGILQSFNYKTTNNVQMNIAAKDKNGKALEFTNVQIFDKDPAQGGKLLVEGVTGNAGDMQFLKALPTHVTDVYIIGDYLGKETGITVLVSENKVEYVLAIAAVAEDKKNSQLPDSDSDGIPDINDKYPSDATRAYNNFTEGTLAFEDLWPFKGDFDMNDLVINYKFNRVTNAQNKVIEIKSDFAIDAVGGAQLNGFAFQLPVASGAVKSVTGIQVKHNYITLNTNNVESGQDNATIIVFDDVYDHIPNVSGFFNTQLNLPRSYTDTMHVTVSFTNPVDINLLGDAPFNPFMIVQHNRGKEIHLPGMLPTIKANKALFGTGDDNTKPEINNYYKSKDNLPFALNIPERFDYPIERASIADAYLKYTKWAQSAGKTLTNWYMHDNNGFREKELIYTK